MCNHDHKNKKRAAAIKKGISPSAKITDDHHDEEHSSWNRRSFLRALGLVGGGSIALGGSNLTASSPSRMTAALANAASEDRVLVLVRLKGGNDGLNTIVPIYDYDFYAGNRPSVRHQENSLYQLNSDFGIPPSMQPLQSLWGEGAMKVIHGVGYPDQNLSHFRSSDIWASGQSIEVEDTGVLGRYFEGLYPDFLISPPEIPPAIQIGSIGNLIFDGAESSYAFSVADPQQLSSIAENGVIHDVTDVPGCTFGEQLEFMRGITNTTFTYAGVINEAYEAATNAVEYQNQSLGRQLAIVARMIKGGLGTKVYLVTLGGFDTHANQVEVHNNRMNQVAQGMKDFYEDLAASGMQDKVMSMTFSEFGRRIEENGSNGTDHGAASPVMVFGDGLQGNGFVGSHPDLQNPDANGNLQFGTDFRSVYATMMKEWLCIDGGTVDELLFGDYETVDLGFSCDSLGVTDLGQRDTFQHFGTYSNGRTYLEFTMPTTAKVDITLFNILGQPVGTLSNDFLMEGPYKIDVQEQIKKRLFTGQYIYQISFAGRKYSKSILIR
ncbi:DUF1501 domain-containing protein [Dokdonia sinensis]|uniref:DUF1501 domain-containing protein n=1 Tax=Dokdonia sinensis TaxID=2479847 RepID=A0A3M0G3M0_9FLAO|nr:DUF1501 domain-containing protein [Dokdonia sinensis]RMB59118.1 DUF1501 domain-containing protein [Dokdonia sinensis]